MNEEKILAAIAGIGETMQQGFAQMNGRFEALERRLGIQEKETARQSAEAALQAEELRKLKEIVYSLAEEKPARTMPQGTAVLKEDAYPRFQEQGYTPRKALCALRDAGEIHTAPEKNTGKVHNTITVKIDGKCKRVIIVTGKGKED